MNIYTKEQKWCIKCNSYEPYYIKTFEQYEKLDIGRCIQTKETKGRCDTCEKFSLKVYGSVSFKQMALVTLTENINVLADIKQILEDDDEEDLEYFVAAMKKRRKKGAE